MINRIKAKLRRELGKLFYKKKALFPAGRRVVSFSFDDFPVSAVEAAGRILEANNIRGTYYASLGMAGEGSIPSKEDMLAVSRRGHEVGSHTYSHINCGESSAAAVEADCKKNQQVADQVSGLRLDSFAYPFGEYRPSTKKIARSMFASARTVEAGINRGCVDLLNLYAVPIDVGGGINTVKVWVDRLKELDGWIIFYTHEVCESPTQYGSTEALFSQSVDLCVEANFELMTVGEAAKLCRLL